MRLRSSAASRRLAVDHFTGAAGGLDLLSGRAAESMRADGQLGRDLASSEHLDGVLAGREACGPQRLRRDLRPGVEPRIEVGDVDRLRVRAKRPDRHRLLLRRAARLSHPHEERVLTALVGDLALRAGPRAVALVTAACGLAGARALAAAKALSRLSRA